MNFFDSTLFFFLLLFIFLNIVVRLYWTSILPKNLSVKYNTIQKIHQGNTPRLGGTVFYFVFLIYVLILNDNFLINILLISLPIIIIATIEDIFHNISPIIRAITIFFSTILFMLINDIPLPQISLFFLDDLMFPSFVLIPLYFIGIFAITNGINFIDGVNGLSIMTCIFIFLVIFLLSTSLNDLTFSIISFKFICFLLVMFIFNYPSGSIFLGDSGTYFLGFLISIIVISFYGYHPELPTWGAILILIYPITEILFTIIRRFWKKKSLFSPDKLHIHNLLYDRIKFLDSDRLKNNIVLPILFPLWCFPLTIMLNSVEDISGILVYIFIYFFLYPLYYFIIFRYMK